MNQSSCEGRSLCNTWRKGEEMQLQGCNNRALRGGVCNTHGGLNVAVMMDVLINPLRGECVQRMARSKYDRMQPQRMYPQSHKGMILLEAWGKNEEM